MNKFFIVFLFLITPLPLIATGDAEVPGEGSFSVYGTTDIVAGLSFPPFANAKQRDFTIGEMKKMSIDRIRIAIDWRSREPLRGSYYWAPMDLRMNTAKDHNLSIFLTIASIGPDWACLSPGSDGACLLDEDALQTFIEKLLLRYTNIDKIQFGNEWEAGAPDGSAYTDRRSVEKFVAYTNILFHSVRRHSPSTKVVLGGLTRTFPVMEYFMSRGNYPDLSGISLAHGATEVFLKGKFDKIKAFYNARGIKQNVEYVFEHAKYDMIDIHLYDDPENWKEYLTVLPRGIPVIVSEFGGPNSEFEETCPDYQAARMEDYIDAIEELPITEAYYFKLVESDSSYHKDSGLFFKNLKTKPAHSVFVRRLSPKR